MTIELKQIQLRKVDIETRMPFRYGIATLTQVPYLIIVADFEVDGKVTRGLAADVLPPKWFTKRPDASIEDEISEMLWVIQSACDSAIGLDQQPNAFRFWQQLAAKQHSDQRLVGKPPLLTNFGVSLVERAAIDAVCRRHEVSFHDAIRSDVLGFCPQELYAELSQSSAAEYLPPKPSATISIRHTVGLSDPLTDDEIHPGERLHDGLPQSLAACIESYGIHYLKIKVPKDFDEAFSRLSGVAGLLSSMNRKCRFTLDGNEFFTDADEFRIFWQRLQSDSQMQAFCQDGLLVVEQPLHRDVALCQKTADVFNAWHDRPAMIIDESDGQLSSLGQALAVGYVGTSHKNCKGVFKGIANACYLKHRNEQQEGQAMVCTGEDLMNLGPIALLQDLAVAASIGLTHVERNGHHYVAGLSPFPDSIQQQVFQHHPDLYCQHRTGEETFPTLAIDQGAIQLRSVNQACFGYAISFQETDFELVGDVLDKKG